MNNNNTPLILVSNDDGYLARGVRFLIDRLVKFGDVVAICPDGPRSGQSMAITVNDALKVSRLPDYNGAKMYKVSGTPVDCVKLAMHTLLPRCPDLVVTGINHGSNSAVNVLYSGTMGAAMEGCAFGIPSIGFSLNDHSADADFTPCIDAVDILVEQTLEHGLPQNICLNVNIPKLNHAPEGMKLAVACKGKWNDEYKEYTDPQGNKFYWLTGEYVNDEPDNDKTDEWCLTHGMVSIVPVALERTAPICSEIEWLREITAKYQANS